MNNFDDIPDHGGRRAGAGRPSGSRNEPGIARKRRASRARREAAVADLKELEFQRLGGMYLDRAAVINATDTLQGVLADAVRSIPSRLAAAGIPAKFCAIASRAIETDLAAAADVLAKVVGPRPTVLVRQPDAENDQ